MSQEPAVDVVIATRNRPELLRAAVAVKRQALRVIREVVRANPREPRAHLALAVASGALSPHRALAAANKRGRGI